MPSTRRTSRRRPTKVLAKRGPWSPKKAVKKSPKKSPKTSTKGSRAHSRRRKARTRSGGERMYTGDTHASLTQISKEDLLSNIHRYVLAVLLEFNSQHKTDLSPDLINYPKIVTEKIVNLYKPTIMMTEPTHTPSLTWIFANRAAGKSTLLEGVTGVRNDMDALNHVLRQHIDTGIEIERKLRQISQLLKEKIQNGSIPNSVQDIDDKNIDEALNEVKRSVGDDFSRNGLTFSLNFKTNHTFNNGITVNNGSPLNLVIQRVVVSHITKYGYSIVTEGMRPPNLRALESFKNDNPNLQSLYVKLVKVPDDIKELYTKSCLLSSNERAMRLNTAHTGNILLMTKDIEKDINRLNQFIENNVDTFFTTKIFPTQTVKIFTAKMECIQFQRKFQPTKG